MLLQQQHIRIDIRLSIFIHNMQLQRYDFLEKYAYLYAEIRKDY